MAKDARACNSNAKVHLRICSENVNTLRVKAYVRMTVTYLTGYWRCKVRQL